MNLKSSMLGPALAGSLGIGLGSASAQSLYFETRSRFRSSSRMRW
jgi:hypothetical protein